MFFELVSILFAIVPVMITWQKKIIIEPVLKIFAKTKFKLQHICIYFVCTGWLTEQNIVVIDLTHIWYKFWPVIEVSFCLVSFSFKSKEHLVK